MKRWIPDLRRLGLWLTCAAMLTAGAAEAQTGREIMQTQKDRHDTASEVSLSTMTLINAKGRRQERRMVTLRIRNADGQSRSLVKYLAPNDIANVGLLTWEQPGDVEDDQWLYLPASGDVKRIVGGSKKNAFMGSDIAYEDMRAEDLDVHDYALTGEETLDGKPVFVVEARPATATEKEESGYGRRVHYILKDLYVTVRTDYYDHRDRLLKRAVYTDLENVGGDVWRANASRIETVRSGTATETLNEQREIDADIPEETFATQNIKRRSRYR
ncbi:outer membrane lipoprotein-sorting protein [Albimonas sp. CAU 1670]|uniref:outer membrane lipoprotein-sorting protein n=1 Tax=Albimonas sp. CAU 1670 TaxID=3032599 RepID=UPI0023DA0CE1|nr:outer membrane lipoprotein-sorting protein [Albimonas sp. CAU 1670]MDF2235863.1 outer membrane lipoprotein-sorting protein [Albimonas sp. CAU 1670]